MSNEAIFKAIRDLTIKFTSGNDVPIERATITSEEFTAIIQYIKKLEKRLDSEYKQVKPTTNFLMDMDMAAAERRVVAHLAREYSARKAALAAQTDEDWQEQGQTFIDEMLGADRA